AAPEGALLEPGLVVAWIDEDMLVANLRVLALPLHGRERTAVQVHLARGVRLGVELLDASSDRTLQSTQFGLNNFIQP
ncbi:MAG: hypothetical protein ACT4P9_16785, partial [Betaproteobacteria bacterium]